MKTEFDDIRITGIAAAIPNRHVLIGELEEQGVDAATIEKFQKSTGVQGRYESGKKQTTSDLCFAAAKELLIKNGTDKNEIGVLILVTQSEDYIYPASACVLQHRLGLSNECIAFDVNLGCSGYTCGLQIVSSLLQMSDKKKALLLVGDVAIKEKDKELQAQDSNANKMLFGDAGTATLLEKSDNADKIYCMSRTDGEGFRAIIAPYSGQRNPDATGKRTAVQLMDDVTVFNFATAEAPRLIQEAMALTGATPSDYTSLVLHQANLFIMKRITKKAGFLPEQMLVSIDEFANTNGASIPITLVKQYGDTQKNDKIRALLCGYGVGLSWSTVDCHLNTGDILPLIHTDEYFEDGFAQD